jgi:hypothetical protein
MCKKEPTVKFHLPIEKVGEHLTFSFTFAIKVKLQFQLSVGTLWMDGADHHFRNFKNCIIRYKLKHTLN